MVTGELAARRVPDLSFTNDAKAPTLRTLAERWQVSRVDVSTGTADTYTVALNRLLPRLGPTPVDKIDPQTVADLVAELHAAGLKKQSIRKTLSILGMVLDHGKIEPNPVRDRSVKLPRKRRKS